MFPERKSKAEEWPVVIETKAFCKELDAILKKKLPHELAIYTYRLTLALESRGFFVFDLGHHLRRTMTNCPH